MGRAIEHRDGGKDIETEKEKGYKKIKHAIERISEGAGGMAK